MKTLLLAVLYTTTAAFNPGKPIVKVIRGKCYIIVTKSKYRMDVFDDSGLLISYPVVFGNNDMGDKLREGDRKTPEGTFTIVSKRVHEKWDRFMMLDYPTKDSYTTFNNRKAQGVIPTNASIGGSIGIHGTWPNEEFAVDTRQNWTLGCISMKNEHIEQLYSFIPVGTKVFITR